jgi:hypothetical protein
VQNSTVPSAAQSSVPGTVAPAPDVNADTGTESVPPAPSTPPIEVPPAGNTPVPAATAPAPYVNAAETAKSPTTPRNNGSRTPRSSAGGTNAPSIGPNSSAAPGGSPGNSAANAAAQAEQAANTAAAAAAQLEELEKQFDQISTRSNAVSTSLDTLRQQQASQGLNLRGDMSASEERLHTYINRAQAALQGQDIASAEKYLKLAEPELEKIEKFLGH